MDLELIKQLYEENADKKIGTLVNLHLMGEPTLHPELIEILKIGSSKKVKTNLTTNISTLGAKNITKILNALYGTITASHMTPTKETYHVRGAVGISWDQSKQSLSSFKDSRYKESLFFIADYVLSRVRSEEAVI